MSDNELLTRLKAAYAQWHATKAEGDAVRRVFIDLMAEDVRIRSVVNEAPGLGFTRPRFSREQAVDYMMEITAHWRMVHWTPETYVAEGNRIAMFGRCAWENRGTGKVADGQCAHLWTFENGRAVELVELFDTARAVAAATPD